MKGKQVGIRTETKRKVKIVHLSFIFGADAFTTLGGGDLHLVFD